MKLPRYTRTLKGNLYYQRDIPTRLKHLTSKKTFTYPLSLKAVTASESAIVKAHSIATDAYTLHCRMLEESNPEAFSSEDLEKAAIEVLRKMTMQSFMCDSRAETDIACLKNKQKAGVSLSFEEKAKLVAYENLWSVSNRKRETLSALWGEYASYKGIGQDTRASRRRKTRWLRWLAIVGDQQIAPNTINIIHKALDRHVAERLEVIKASSVKREINDIMAILRHANQQHRYGWVLQPPRLPKCRSITKQVLTHDEQRRLVTFCLANTDDPVAICVLLQFQGAMMPSEVARLTERDLALDALIPHVTVSGETKTTARKRVIPVVIGADAIAGGLPVTIAWLQGTTDSNHSHRIKRLLHVATGNSRLTGHCLRHTFKANCIANGADTNSAAAIAGWSGSTLGISAEMLSYGSEGLSNSDVLAGLMQESLKIHGHLAEHVCAG